MGGNGTILTTVDGGTTWIPEQSGTAYSFSQVCFPDTETGYIAGENGTILKTGNGGFPVSIPNQGIVGKQVNIYPNPCSSLVTIDVSENRPDLLFEILNLQGKVLITLRPDGRSAKVDVGNMQPGVYLVRISGKDRVEVRKLIRL